MDLVHGSAVRAICEVLLALDVEPDELLRLSGFSSQGGISADATSFAALGCLTALCVKRTRCSLFGLMVGQRTTLSVNRRPKRTQDRRPKGTHRLPRMSANVEADGAQPVGSAKRHRPHLQSDAGPALSPATQSALSCASSAAS